jgi:hypothetical protein
MKTDNSKQKIISVALPDAQPRKLLKKRALVLAALLAALFVADQRSASLIPRLCPWYNLTGIDCPFCGLTRSVIATADFHPIRAIQMHPFGPAVLAVLIAWLVLCCLGLIRGGWTLKIPRWIAISVGVVSGFGWLGWWLFTVFKG